MYEILPKRAILKITGPDSLKFLQNLTTNDIQNNDYCYSMLLNNHGRYLFDFFVSKISSEEFIIDIDKLSANQFISRLRLYKLRANLNISEKLEDINVIYSKDLPNFKYISYNKDPRTKLMGFRIIAKQSELLRSVTGLYTENILRGSKVISAEDNEVLEPTKLTQQRDNLNLEVSQLYNNDKYNYAVPDGVTDLIYEKSIPLEYGLEDLNGISYTKGCYIGQELMSRTKYQGMIRKKIFKVESSSHLLSEVPSYSEIILNNEKIGFICSSFKNLGIAIIKMDDFNLLYSNTCYTLGLEIKLTMSLWRK